MIVAAGISVYMSYVSLTGSSVAGCGGGGTFSCDHVLTSRYSKLAGVPVGIPAVGLYLSGLVALGIATGRIGKSHSMTSLAWSYLGVISAAATLAGLWFVGLQIFVIEHLCPYCLGVHSCGAVLLALVSVHRDHFPGASQIATSVALVSPLVLGQTLIEPPPTYRLEKSVSVGPASNDMSSPAHATATMGDGADAMTFESPTFEAPTFDSPVFDSPVFESPVFEAPTSGALKSEAAPASPTTGRPAATEPVHTEPAHTEPVIFEPPVVPSHSSAKGRSFESSARRTASVLSWVSLFSPIAVTVPDANTSNADSPDSDSTGADASDAAATATGPTADRMVPISNGKLKLNIRQWPLWGDADSKYVVAMLFDYTCPHCQRTHEAIRGAAGSIDGGLAVLTLPVPLYRGCNSASQTTDPKYAFRCEVAKIGVAVWLAQPTQYSAFHDWIMSGERTLAEVRAKADQVVGAEALAKQLSSGVPQQFVDKHVYLYRDSGAGTVPKLIFPTTTLVGEITSPDALVNIVRQNAAK